jgi:hypothetical protein
MFRSSMRESALAVAVAVASILAAAPALYLVNQEIQIIPTAHAYYLGSIYGYPVTNSMIFWCSLAVALCLALLAAGLFWIANRAKPRQNP